MLAANANNTEPIAELERAIDTFLYKDHVVTFQKIDQLLDIYKDLGKPVKLVQTYVKKAESAKHHLQVIAMENILANAYDAYNANAEIIDQEVPTLKHELANQKGDYFMELGNFEKAIHVFKDIITDIESQDSISYEAYNMLIGSYQYLGWINKILGRYDDALNLLFKSIDVQIEQDKSINSKSNYEINYARIAQVYLLKNEYDSSKKYYKKSLDKLEDLIRKKPQYKARVKNFAIRSYNKYARLFELTGQEDQAKAILEKSLSYHENGDPQFMTTYLQLGKMAANKADLELALDYFKKALHLKKEHFGEGKDYQQSEIYAEIALVLHQQKKWEDALQAWQQSILHTTKQFQSLDRKENPELKHIISKKNLLTALAGKSKTLQRWSDTTQDRSLLEQSFQTALLATELIDDIRFDYSSDMDKAFLIEQSYPIFETAIQTAARLGSSYTATAFNLIERSKGLLLFEAFRKSRNTAELPEAIVHKELQYKTALSGLEDLINKQKEEELEKPEFLKTRNQFHELKQNYQNFLGQLKKDYPQYYNLRHGQHLVNVMEIQQKLKPDESILEFFVGNENIFALVINKNELHIENILLDFPLTEWVNNMRNGIFNYYLSNDRNATIYEQSANLYCKSAYQIFKKIIQPISNKLNQKVVIVPDGPLGYVPFDALLKTEAGVATDFRQHDYLIDHYQFSYHYSVSLLKNEQKSSKALNNVLAFAPSFHGTMNNKTAQLRNSLVSLFHNENEVKAICNLLDGDNLALIGREANKANFLKNAADFKVLHFATHGILDDQNSDYSYIAFSDAEQENNNAKLYLRELYNIRLNADLVTLSACETGLGKLERGEGIISLARGFSYAGAMSILTTLWAVNDLSTSTIMMDFYKNLADGEAKDQALKTAKTTYLQTAKEHEDAHPFYWAAYIPIGEMAPLYKSSVFNWKFPVGLGILLLIGGWFRFKKN